MGNMVKKLYICPTCQMQHSIEFQADLAKTRSKYPFTYVYIHKFEGKPAAVEETGADVLTTLYIDAQLNIRGVETTKQDAITDIVSKETTKSMSDALTNHILQLQEDYNVLLKKYQELSEKYKKMGGK